MNAAPFLRVGRVQSAENINRHADIAAARLTRLLRAQFRALVALRSAGVQHRDPAVAPCSTRHS
jgi:hypothetical protein